MLVYTLSFSPFSYCRSLLIELVFFFSFFLSLPLPIDFQQHFKEISKKHSSVARPFYFHLTSVIDTRSTAMTLATVEEGILREHLRKASLM